MTVEQTDVIDIIYINQSGVVVATISDHLPWNEDTEDHLYLLQEKINKYLAFIEGGEILDSYPKAKGRTTEIEVIAKYPFNEEALEFLQKAKEVVVGAGIGFSYKLHETIN